MEDLLSHDEYKIVEFEVVNAPILIFNNECRQKVSIYENSDKNDFLIVGCEIGGNYVFFNSKLKNVDLLPKHGRFGLNNWNTERAPYVYHRKKYTLTPMQYRIQTGNFH